METQNKQNVERENGSDLPDFLGIAEAMLAAAEAGDMAAVETHRQEFAEAGGRHYQNLRDQGFKEEEIISGAYLTNPSILKMVKGGNK